VFLFLRPASKIRGLKEYNELYLMGTTQSFLKNIEWRRAVKHFKDGHVDTSPIVNAVTNAPSSFGLQPYKVIVVTNKELKDKLVPVSFNQPQVGECSSLFVFCYRKDVDARAEEYMKEVNASNGLRDMITGFLSHLHDKEGWAAKQTYIALGFALAAAAEEMIASCPMEGFMGNEVAKILDLPDTLVPCVYLAVGQASDIEEGPRFRFPVTDLFMLKE